MNKALKKEKDSKQASPAGEAASPPEETREEKLERELAEKNEQFLRLYAEFDNFRKRSQKEKQDIRNLERAEIINALLPVIDNFERAQLSAEADFENYKKGVGLIFTQLCDILTKQGVTAFGEPGDEFDPAMHNAVMHIEDETLGESVVAEVFSKGYRLGETVIRFAAVKVAN